MLKPTVGMELRTVSVSQRYGYAPRQDENGILAWGWWDIVGSGSRGSGVMGQGSVRLLDGEFSALSVHR